MRDGEGRNVGVPSDDRERVGVVGVGRMAWGDADEEGNDCGAGFVVGDIWTTGRGARPLLESVLVGISGVFHRHLQQQLGHEGDTGVLDLVLGARAIPSLSRCQELPREPGS